VPTLPLAKTRIPGNFIEDLLEDIHKTMARAHAWAAGCIFINPISGLPDRPDGQTEDRRSIREQTDIRTNRHAPIRTLVHILNANNGPQSVTHNVEDTHKTMARAHAWAADCIFINPISGLPDRADAQTEDRRSNFENVFFVLVSRGRHCSRNEVFRNYICYLKSEICHHGAVAWGWYCEFG